ncbi:hypothetical protein Y032_0011g1305 [Ancylostoma ceylanicum]|uniref:Major sperm protein n=1 Tax=Ancylostoma ceylanicum TaxID=53326 RepID=A0A016VDC0_9BILA|nr:hypothetical protein Y032_0011g1305 [Ancylostoma ceylanicum]
MQNQPYTQIRARSGEFPHSDFSPMTNAPSSDHCGGNVDLSTREVLILAIMCGFAAFNLHSADTKSFLNVFTLVPAILFTFKILMINKDNSTVGVGIVAMFWMYYGMGVVCDVLFGTGEGYLAVQLVLLGALGVSAYRGGLPDQQLSAGNNDVSDILSRVCSFVKHRQNSEERVVYNGSPFMETMKAPTYKGFHSNLSHTESTQDLSTATALEFDKETAERTLLTAILNQTDTALEIFPNEAEKPPMDLTETAPPSKPAFADSESSVLVHYGDLIAEPDRMIQFRHHTDSQKITITNISGRNIAWTVKTNAIYEIGASPSQGTLRKGAKAEINVVLNADKVAIPDAVRYSDKLAIDYSFVDDTKARFKRRRMKPNATKRYQFDILYRF